MTWNAVMISPDEDFHGAPLLRKEFTLEPAHGAVVQATLQYTALGVIEASINGHRVDSAVLTPGWSSYEWRLRVASTDVTSLLSDTFVIGLALGNGWFRGRLGWTGQQTVYGQELGAFAELTITYADGHHQVCPTDETWHSGPSATLANDLYDGQIIDARERDTNWDRPGYDHTRWVGVHRQDLDLSVLEPYIGPPVARQQEITPVRSWSSPSGTTLVDFGQNLVGWIRLRVHGAAGDTVTVRHAEVLEHGELATRPLRSARATDTYTLSGDTDTFEPTFTFHGFRFAEITGWPGELQAGDVTAIVVSSDLQRIGTFTCSNPDLTQFHRNVVWGMRGNFLDVPTDCPQRDERLGWTGDISAFAPTAAFLYDVAPFLRDWLRDLDQEQRHHDGLVPYVVPDVMKYMPHPTALGAEPETTAIWSDAAVWVPWALWEAYGDRQVLDDQYESMVSHVRRVRSLLSPTGLWDQGFQFGDWLDPDAPPEDPAKAKADPSVVATACAYRTVSLMARIARLLDQSEAAEFEELALTIRNAFNTHYVHDGVVASDSTTAYSLAIVFGLLSGTDQARAGDRLAELATANDYRISTGFAGTPFIADALTITGHLDDAYRLVLEKECPSWLYPVTMGATTVWERWDSLLPDGTVNPGQMTSFNHYALGAVADWMHRTIGGLVPLEPGYKTMLIQPQPGGDITSADTSLITPFGRASVSWQLVDEDIVVDVEVPPGTTAIIRLPHQPDVVAPAGVHRVRSRTAQAA